MRQPSQYRAKDVLALNRIQLRMVTSVLQSYMMRQLSQYIAEDVLVLNRIQLRTVTSLQESTYLYEIGVFKDEAIHYRYVYIFIFQFSYTTALKRVLCYQKQTRSCLELHSQPCWKYSVGLFPILS